MARPGGGAGLFWIAAVLVGLPLGLGLVLLGISGWTFATSNANFDRQVASVMGVIGAMASAPAAVWGLASASWIRGRMAAGARSEVVTGLGMLGVGAVIGLALAAAFLFAP